jgi:hypothetical protein
MNLTEPLSLPLMSGRAVKSAAQDIDADKNNRPNVRNMPVFFILAAGYILPVSIAVFPTGRIVW